VLILRGGLGAGPDRHALRTRGERESAAGQGVAGR
jgi:hypothetical protein